MRATHVEAESPAVPVVGDLGEYDTLPSIQMTQGDPGYRPRFIRRTEETDPNDAGD